MSAEQRPRRDDGPSEMKAEIDWHEPRGAGTAMRCRCGARWPCPVRRLADERDAAEIKQLEATSIGIRACEDLIAVKAERDAVRAAHARCTNLSNAEAFRIVEEAKEMRAARDIARRRIETMTFEAEELRRQRDAALARVRRRDHIIESAASAIASRDEEIAVFRAAGAAMADAVDGYLFGDLTAVPMGDALDAWRALAGEGEGR